MVKKFTYRGKELEELEQMQDEEFAKLLKARKRRTLLRSQNRHLTKKAEKALVEKQAGKDPKPVRTHLRSTVIVPKFVGLRFAVYNGKEFIQVEVKPEMIGHFLGEFALTRKRIMHGKAGIGATKSSTAVNARG